MAPEGPTGRKNVAAEFPDAIRRTFCWGGGVNQSHSTGPPFLPRGRGGGERGEAWGETDDEGAGGRVGRVLEGWTALASPASASADVEFTLLPRSISLPLPTRASGQFEITLSPSQCVQSKLQFKSSLLTEGGSGRERARGGTGPVRSAEIRNTENSSSRIDHRLIPAVYARVEEVRRYVESLCNLEAHSTGSPVFAPSTLLSDSWGILRAHCPRGKKLRDFQFCGARGCFSSWTLRT